MLNNNDPIVIELQRLRQQVNGLLQRERLAYVTGTWTPTCVGNSTAGVFTYSSQVGLYIQIENLVYITGRVTISAIDTPPVGNMTIAGLPLNVNASYSPAFNFSIISNFNYSASALQLTARFLPGATTIQLIETFDNSVALQVPAANFTNAACDLAFSGVYSL